MKFLTKLVVMTGLAVLIVGVVVWKVPAGWILDGFNWQALDLSYDRMTGTLWQAEVEGVRRRDLELGKVSWDFQTINGFSPLNTTWLVEGDGLDYQMSFYLDVVGRSPQELRLVQGHIPAGWVDLSDIVPLVYLTGTFNIDLDRASPRGELGRLATGTVRWTDAGLDGLVEEPLGEVTVDLSQENRFTLARVTSEETAESRIDGEIRFNQSQYRVELVFRTIEAKRYLVEQLAHLGTVREDGSLLISLSGRLQQ